MGDREQDVDGTNAGLLGDPAHMGLESKPEEPPIGIMGQVGAGDRETRTAVSCEPDSAKPLSLRSDQTRDPGTGAVRAHGLVEQRARQDLSVVKWGRIVICLSIAMARKDNPCTRGQAERHSCRDHHLVEAVDRSRPAVVRDGEMQRVSSSQTRLEMAEPLSGPIEVVAIWQ